MKGAGRLLGWLAVLAACGWGGCAAARAQDDAPSLAERAHGGPLGELETDREAFTPATNVPGRRVWITELSYTYIDNRDAFDTNSAPEMLVRFGWFENIEVRMGFNYEVGGGGNVVSAMESSELGGGPDLSGERWGMCGLKVQVSQQQGWMPRSCAIVEGFYTDHGDIPPVRPVATYAFGWLLDNGWRFDSALRYARASDGEELPDGEVFNRWTPSTVLRMPLSDKFQVHLGCFASFTEGRREELTRAFISPGAHYNFTPNLELGLRVGWGLTPDAANFFVNTGLGLRF